MKKFLSILSLCFVVIMLFTLSGCGKIVLKNGPSKTDSVSSNGSMVVRKGDYLYFVNGYQSNKDLKGNDNNYGVAKNGAIYRAKLINGELQYDVTVNEDGEEVKTLKDVELLVPMVAGFEYTNLYIFGNTLYFSTPNTEKDKEGTIRFDLTDICAVNINGGKVSKIANALNITGKDDFNFSYLDGKVYLTYLTDKVLYNVRINGTKVESRVKIANSVSSYKVSETNDNNANYVYYTRSFKEDEHNITGNVLAKTELKTNKETILSNDNENTYSVKRVVNGKLYYTRTNNLTTNSYIYSKSLNNFQTSEEQQYTVVAYTKDQYIFDLGEGYANGVIVSENDRLLFLVGTTSIEDDIISLYDKELSVLGIYGEFVYGKDAESNLLRINIQTKKVETILTNENELNFDMKTNFDYENGYVYYYVKYVGENETVGYYLNRVYLGDENKISELVGVVLDNHISINNKD